MSKMSNMSISRRFCIVLPERCGIVSHEVLSAVVLRSPELLTGVVLCPLNYYKWGIMSSEGPTAAVLCPLKS